MRQLTLFILLLLTHATLWAQLTDFDTLRFGYRASVSGSWITGNVERLLVNTQLELSHVGPHIGLKTSNLYMVGTIYRNMTENDILSRNFIYLNPRKRCYPYVMIWLQSSLRQKINFRYQAGPGVSYGLISQKAHQIKISATVSTESTWYDGTDFVVDPENLKANKVSIWRATFRLVGHHWLWNNRLKVNYESWYQSAFGDSRNWRYYLNASLDIPMTKRIAFRSAILYTHDSIVLTNIKHDDKMVTFGISYSNF